MNRYRPHVLVLPEDRANSQLANGFLLQQDVAACIKVLEEAGGWTQVLDRFESDQVADMQRFPTRSMVLLIDFDGDEDRLNKVKARIPAALADRVFVLGAWTEPEGLKRANLGSYEAIGLRMAQDCRNETNTIWGHHLLQHNAGELDRLRQHVRPILFPSAT